MATAVKKAARKTKPVAKRPVPKSASSAKNGEKFDRTSDAAERRKISQTIDPEAFLRFHNANNKVNAAYWQAKE